MNLSLGSFATTTFGTPVTGEIVGINHLLNTVTLYVYDEETATSQEIEVHVHGLQPATV